MLLGGRSGRRIIGGVGAGSPIYRTIKEKPGGPELSHKQVPSQFALQCKLYLSEVF